MKILHLIEALDFSDGARELRLLAPAQRDDGAEVEVACLGAESAWSAALAGGGVRVHCFGWRRWLDFPAVFRLREILDHFSPDVIHVWSVSALRLIALGARGWLPTVVLSGPRAGLEAIPWWDRVLFGRVRCRAADGVAKARRLGATERIGGFTIVCAGNFQRENGFRQAIWAFDMLVPIYPDAQLHLVGASEQEPELRALARGLQNDGNVQFLGMPLDVSAVLECADVVWTPSLTDCGYQTALEAMALGRAVVASAIPSLRALITDGETGCLVPPGDVVALARRTHALLQDDWQRGRLGESARQFVAAHHSPPSAVERWRNAYQK